MSKLKLGYTWLSELSDLVLRCPHCGHIQCRNENVAINLPHAPEDKVRLA